MKAQARHDYAPQFLRRPQRHAIGNEDDPTERAERFLDSCMDAFIVWGGGGSVVALAMLMAWHALRAFGVMN